MKKLKVFHGLVNYGTQAGLLSNELRKNGIEAISVAYQDQYKRQIDIEILGGKSIVDKSIKFVWYFLKKFNWFFKYNTFHFYYGSTLFKNQRDLPFYKLFGKKVIMEYLGNDVQNYKVSTTKYKWTNVNHFITANEAEEYDRRNELRLKNETPYLSKQLVCAPCYSEFVTNSEVLPLAIDINHYKYTEFELSYPIKIMHAPTHRGFKGTDYILKALEKLQEENFNIEIMLVENISHAELKQKYGECHLFIDQIMGGWYGTASIEAMAIGRPVVCSIRPTYFDFIDYGQDIPIIHSDPDNIYEVLKSILSKPEKLKEIGIKSRLFVEQIHDLKKVTQKLIKIYQNL